MAQDCTSGPLPRSGPADAFTAMWNIPAAGWNGGDGALSTALPDGRVAWVFGDTLLGGGRFVRNSLVVQDGACLTTRYGGNDVWPRSFVEPADPAEWYWPSQPFVEDGRLVLPLSRMRRTGSGDWDFAAVGTDLATFTLPGLQLEQIRPVPGGARVLWGAAEVDDGTHSYVFGVQDGGLVKDVHVARAPKGELAGAPWEYWDGTGWSGDPASSVSVLSGVSNQLSVLRTDDGWALLSQRTFFSPEVAAYRAPDLTGPYDGGTTIATFAVPAGALSYNAVAHPELGTDGGLLVSTSLNALAGGDLATQPDLYRPRFLRVALP